MKAYFSIGGEIYNPDVVTYTPMTDEIFEEPRNISAKLHRRIGRFVKVQLYFASKWMLISEVSFDSSLARGNYSVEVKESEVRDIQQDSGQHESRRQKVLPPPVKNSDDMAQEDVGEEICFVEITQGKVIEGEDARIEKPDKASIPLVRVQAIDESKNYKHTQDKINMCLFLKVLMRN